nr:MAG TPA: hypothetical protein [Caudoviricetes sp.]
MIFWKDDLCLLFNTLSQGQKSELKSEFTPACSPVPVGSQTFLPFLRGMSRMLSRDIDIIDFVTTTHRK